MTAGSPPGRDLPKVVPGAPSNDHGQMEWSDLAELQRLRAEVARLEA